MQHLLLYEYGDTVSYSQYLVIASNSLDISNSLMMHYHTSKMYGLFRIQHTK